MTDRQAQHPKEASRIHATRDDGGINAGDADRLIGGQRRDVRRGHRGKDDGVRRTIGLPLGIYTLAAGLPVAAPAAQAADPIYSYRHQGTILLAAQPSARDLRSPARAAVTSKPGKHFHRLIAIRIGDEQAISSDRSGQMEGIE
jgi:hypothetical protein